MKRLILFLLLLPARTLAAEYCVTVPDAEVVVVENSFANAYKQQAGESKKQLVERRLKEFLEEILVSWNATHGPNLLK